MMCCPLKISSKRCLDYYGENKSGQLTVIPSNDLINPHH